MFTYTKLRSPAIECKEGLCISRLVDFELLLELKIEQKNGTPLVKLVLSRRKSGLQTERLSVHVIYFGYRAWFHSDLPNAIIFSVISLLREKPLLTGILDVFCSLKIQSCVSSCKRV
jgi:hypothetical protein